MSASSCPRTGRESQRRAISRRTASLPPADTLEQPTSQRHCVMGDMRCSEQTPAGRRVRGYSQPRVRRRKSQLCRIQQSIPLIQCRTGRHGASHSLMVTPSGPVRPQVGPGSTDAPRRAADRGGPAPRGQRRRHRPVQARGVRLRTGSARRRASCWGRRQRARWSISARSPPRPSSASSSSCSSSASSSSPRGSGPCGVICSASAPCRWS